MKVNLETIVNPEHQTQLAETLNENFARVADAFEAVLFRDGRSPNTFEANQDANNFRILNLPEPINNTEPLRRADLPGILALVASAEQLLIEVGEAAIEVAADVLEAETAKDDAVVAKDQAEAAALVAQNAANESKAYDLVIFVQGKPENEELVLRMVATRDFEITNDPVTRAVSVVASTGTVEFSLQKNDVEFGVVEFNESDIGVPTITPTAFEAGDILSVVSPAVSDDTLENVSITVPLLRVF